MEELHLDGSISNKVFAPGYGEFDTSADGNTESLALTVPTNAIDDAVPVELRRVSTSAWGILENVRLQDWEAAEPTVGRLHDLWEDLRSGGYPSPVVELIDRAITRLDDAVAGSDVAASSQAAIDVVQGALDLELLYRGSVEYDRFHLHAQQLRVHAANDDWAGVVGEVAVLEWIADRLVNLDDGGRIELDRELASLRSASSCGNLPNAADIVARVAARLHDGDFVS